jgi:hypothetical protein
VTDDAYDPELDHAERVMTQIAERIASASLLALAQEEDDSNPRVTIAENAFMTGIAVGLLAPDWARVMHEEANRASIEASEGPSRMPDIVADITHDFPLGEEA